MAHGGDRVDPERVRVILALETSCDDTCAAVVTERRGDPLERDLLAGRPRPLRRRRAGDRVPPPSRADRRRRRRRARAGRRRRSPSSTWSRSRAGPGWSRALLVGRGDREGARRRVRAAARARRPPARPRRGGVPRPGPVRAAVPQPDRQRRPHAARERRPITVRATRCSARRSTTPPARRSTRARACSGSAIRAARRSSGSPATATRTRSGFPTARASSAGLDFSFAGLKTALLYRIRDLGRGEAERRRADLAASYQRAIVESLAIRVERALLQTGLERLSVGGGVAANGAVRERMRSLGVELHVPARELCTDNAAMIASAAASSAAAVPRLPRPRRVRHRGAGAGRAMTTVVLYSRDGLLSVR